MSVLKMLQGNPCVYTYMCCVFSKFGPQTAGGPPEGLLRDQQGQNHFHNNTKTEVAFFTTLTFALII